MRQSLVVHTLLVAALLVFAVVACPGAAPPASAQLGTTVIFFDDFESGPDGWGPDNGVWQMGYPTGGPGEPHSGQNCWGTGLDVYFPPGVDSRLISPTIQLPSLNAGDEIWLHFWTWADYSSYSCASVQVSYQLPGGGWSPWYNWYTGWHVHPQWVLAHTDLTYFAGKTVRVGFMHDAGTSISFGWCMDDVQIAVETPQFRNPEDFELGWDGWYAENGIWDVGTPTAGPGTAHSGSLCAGTMLDSGSDRLMSPTVQLPSLNAGEELWLEFWMWADYRGMSNGRVGNLQIGYSLPNGSWSWSPLVWYCCTYEDWQLARIELTQYAGKRVRIGFAQTSAPVLPPPNSAASPTFGWYIDDVQILVETPHFRQPEDFELGWSGWHAENGVWEVGPPTAGPGVAHSGTSCVATVLDGAFPAEVPSRLISPPVQLPAPRAGEKIWLHFWSWSDYQDTRYVQVQLSYRLPDGSWSGWQALVTDYSFSNPNWARVAIDLSVYAGNTVKIGFSHYHPYGQVSYGWYIDDVSIRRHTDTVGLYNPATGTSFLRNSNTAGPADLTFRFGPAPSTWTSLSGNWDADWDDTIGLYDPAGGKFYLRNSNSGGPADLTFRFGPAASTWKPIIGDWNGDDTDTIGLYSQTTGTVYLRNSNSAGSADLTFRFGPAPTTWLPITGDWDGDGIDTIGLYSQATGTFYLRNSNSAGPADLTFRFGPAPSGWLPIAGDWNSDGIDTIGLYDPTAGKFYLRNANSAGVADLTFRYGPAPSTWKPIVGEWHAD
jgi:hypothetical protein